jgi:thiosulfate/3-mercaptopyruvate sulfurtransferase
VTLKSGPWIGAAFTLLLTLAGPALGEKGYLRQEILIGTEELAALLDTPSVRIIDATEDESGARIPGAVTLYHLSLTRLEERKKSGYPVSPEEAEKIFGGAGIDADTLVVVYDRGDGPLASAFWFALNFYGHEKVKVLNGGIRKWVKEGRPVTQDPPAVEKKKFVARPNPDLIAPLAWMKRKIRDRDLRILDARSFKEYIGEEILPGASRGGHIPGAIHLEWTKVSGREETFKPAGELRRILEQRGITKDKEIVTYCHTGIGRSTDLLLALKLLGYEKVRLYAGSWEEWSSDPRLPVER